MNNLTEIKAAIYTIGKVLHLGVMQYTELQNAGTFFLIYAPESNFFLSPPSSGQAVAKPRLDPGFAFI